MPLNSQQTIRILLADNHPIMREGLALILDNEDDMTVIAQANNGQEEVVSYRQHQPDVAMLDLRIPLLNGG